MNPSPIQPHTHTKMIEIFAYSFLTLLLIFVISKWFAPGTCKKLPPSPAKFPVIGNLHQLGSFPHRSLQSLAKLHGPLVLLHLGIAPTLIVSSADAAREIMKTHDLIFLNRPDSRIARKLLYDKKDLSQAPYGEYWRQMRSICVLKLLNARRVQLFRSIREKEALLMVKRIEKLAENSLPVDLTEMLVRLANDVVCMISFGRKYSAGESGEMRFKKLLLDFGEALGVFDLGDFIPWLGWINYLNGFNGKVDRVAREFDEFLEELVEIASQRKGFLEEDEMNFLDVLLETQKNGIDSGGFLIEREGIKAIILDMFVAGTDTTYTALEWATTEILKHPEVTQKLQDEIRNIAGNKQLVTEEDVEKMVYLKAVIKESLRLHPPVPLLLPRQATKDVKMMGYDIAAETRVIINAWTIGRDPNSWPEPDEFKPERFLVDNHDVDFKGQHFQLIPFGAGRRGCPGIAFADATIEIGLANIFNRFDWSLPGGARVEGLDVTESWGISVHRKFPLLVIPTLH